jgi:hypothetical protein
MLLAELVADNESITFQPFTNDKKLNFFSNPDVVGHSSTPYLYERQAKGSNCCATLQSPPLL